MKRYLLAVAVVFVAWTLLDFVMHGVILRATYMATAELWRPLPEMKFGLIHLVALVSAFCFVGIYQWLVSPKSLLAGVKYGLLFGLGAGFSMGFGTYSTMAIPLHLAAVWCVGTIVQCLAAGVLVAAIVRD